MVSEEVIIATIRRMLDSGIDKDTIIATLKDTGLKQEEINNYLAQVSGASEKEEQLQERDDAHATQELLHTATHNKLEEHSEKLDSMHQDVSGLHEKIDVIAKGPSNKQLFSELTLLNQKISNLEKQLSDLKAMNSASKSLLEKILETNKKIVEKL